MILITEMWADTSGLRRCVVCAEESNCEQSATGMNSIKFIDYLLLLHDNNLLGSSPPTHPLSSVGSFWG